MIKIGVDRQDILEEVETFMKNYDAEKIEEKLNDEEEAQMDEDGWTKVTKATKKRVRKINRLIDS